MMSKDPHTASAPNWKSRKTIIANLAKNMWEDQREIDLLKAYFDRRDFSNTALVPPAIPYLCLARNALWRGVILAMQEDERWSGSLAEFVESYLLSAQLDYFWHEEFQRQFPDRPPLMSIDWERLSLATASAIVLGAFEPASKLGLLSFATLNRGFQLYLSYHEQHRCAQAFMLRLFAQWHGGAHHDWPEALRSEPIYERLLVNWRDPDAAVVAPLLLAACERHSRQARWDSSTKFYDFGDETVMRTPIEILLVLKLRQLEGLSLPTIDHELMAPPFDTLPSLPEPYPPAPLRDETLRRLRKDWPVFDTIVGATQIARFARGN